jgi:hypothetical protein
VVDLQVTVYGGFWHGTGLSEDQILTVTLGRARHQAQIATELRAARDRRTNAPDPMAGNITSSEDLACESLQAHRRRDQADHHQHIQRTLGYDHGEELDAALET